MIESENRLGNQDQEASLVPGSSWPPHLLLWSPHGEASLPFLCQPLLHNFVSPSVPKIGPSVRQHMFSEIFFSCQISKILPANISFRIFLKCRVNSSLYCTIFKQTECQTQGQLIWPNFFFSRRVEPLQT